MSTPKTSYVNWINTASGRETLISIIAQAELPFGVHLKRDKRTGKQNSRQWAMLNIISKKVEWHGQKLSSEDWKHIFMNALFSEMRMVPNLDGNGFVNLSRSSSSLTVQEHCDLTELIEAFAAREGIDITKPTNQTQVA